MKITSLKKAKQAAFNGAVRGLASQGWEQCVNLQLAHPICKWNLGKPGLHCAIGWLIPWENQESAPQQYLTTAVVTRKFAPVLQKWIDNANNNDVGEYSKFFDFLNSMQNAHDQSTSQLSLYQRFVEIGKYHKVNWPKDARAA